MNITAPYRAVALLFLGSIAPLCAQNFSDTSRLNETRPLAVDDLEGHDQRRFDHSSTPGTFEVPATRAASQLPDGSKVILAQTPALDARQASNRSVDSVVDLAVLREPVQLRRIPVSGDASEMAASLALISATYRTPGEASDKADCSSIGLSVQQRVKLEPANVLEIVAAEVDANNGCACEIVKAALTATGANEELTARIVETAATAAPEQMRIISQCAIAAVPESLAAVQAVLAKLDPNSGESGRSAKSGKEVISAKSAKKAEVSPAPKKDSGNPLDLPPLGPPLPPPPILVPPVTDIDIPNP